MFDIKNIKEEASKELQEERNKEIKQEIKYKMKEIEDAKKIVRNLERELDDLIEEKAS